MRWRPVSEQLCTGCRVMQAFRADAEAHGARIIFNTRVLGGDVTGQVMRVFSQPTLPSPTSQYVG